MHELDSTNYGLIWASAPKKPPSIWTLADQPNASFATATSVATVYFSTCRAGDLVQTSLENGIWQKAVSILVSRPLVQHQQLLQYHAQQFTSINATIEWIKYEYGSSGVRIGVGVPLIAIIGVLAILSLRRWRNLRQPGPPVPKKDPQEIHIPSIRYDLGI